MRLRAIRGAVPIEEDTEGAVHQATAELLRAMLDRNGLHADDVVSIFFTATPDLRSVFPAEAARMVDLHRVPLLCAREIDVEGAMPRVVRVLLHAYTDRGPDEVVHVYVGEARRLREDLA